jgi:hypothetical protein
LFLRRNAPPIEPTTRDGDDGTPHCGEQEGRAKVEEGAGAHGIAMLAFGTAARRFIAAAWLASGSLVSSRRVRYLARLS